MPADVLERGEHFALHVEQRGAVDAAGPGEVRLAGAQTVHRGHDGGRGDQAGRDGQRRAARDHVVYAAPAADAARGGGERAAAGGGKPVDVERYPGAGHHVDDVSVALLIGAAAVRDAADVVARADHALGEEETDRELAIGAGRPHGDGQGFTLRPDLQGLLGDDVVIGGLLQHPAGDSPDLPARDAFHASFNLRTPSSSTRAMNSIPHQLQSTSSLLPNSSKGLFALHAGHSNSEKRSRTPNVGFSSSSSIGESRRRSRMAMSRV